MKSNGKRCITDPKQIERMRHMSSDGLTYADIAQQMGISKSSVWMYLRKLPGVSNGSK